jgi:Tfp pilus assembly protein PilF
MLRLLVIVFLVLACMATLQAESNAPGLINLSKDPSAANPPAAAVDPAPAHPSGQGANDPIVLLHEAIELLQEKQFEAALAKVNAVIQADPKSVDGYGLRGSIYAAKKDWKSAAKDFQSVLQFDPNNIQAKFNLAELEFLQKDYDNARVAFLGLESDGNLGDLAKYKVFLCDLFGGHSDVAAKELDAFDKVGSGASYYFAEAASSLYQKKTEDARSWLTSASNIYSPSKFKLYAASLFDLGYLPLPAPPASN